MSARSSSSRMVIGRAQAGRGRGQSVGTQTMGGGADWGDATGSGAARPRTFVPVGRVCDGDATGSRETVCSVIRRIDSEVGESPSLSLFPGAGGRRANGLLLPMAPGDMDGCVPSVTAEGRRMRSAVSLRTGWGGRGGLLDGVLGRGRRAVRWAAGVAPRVVHKPERRDGLDDGDADMGLGPTLPCRLGGSFRAWDVVQQGEAVSVRVVGWCCAENGQRARVVVWSRMDDGEATSHGEWDEGRSGYTAVGEGKGTVAKRVAGEEEMVVRVGLWKEGSGKCVDGEIRWRCGMKQLRRDGGGVLMRYGYWFFLEEPTQIRWFANTDTPEHVRLVAVRERGDVDEEMCRSISYVVVHVAGM